MEIIAARGVHTAFSAAQCVRFEVNMLRKDEDGSHRHTGTLAHSIEGTAYQIRFRLSNPAIAQKLGEQGHEHVRENFLITGSVRRALTLFLHLSEKESK
jgi:hypothetical protein